MKKRKVNKTMKKTVIKNHRVLKKKRKPAYSSIPTSQKGDRSWFYEEPKGIYVLIEHYNSSNELEVVARAIIPWSHLIKAVNNHKRVQSAREQRYRTRQSERTRK